MLPPQPQQLREGRCHYYVSHKRKFCNAHASAGAQYCGNHLFVALGEGVARVPCPVDPRHSVALADLRSHVARCPRTVALRRQKAQPYCQEDANIGSDEDPDLRAPAGAAAALQPGPRVLEAAATQAPANSSLDPLPASGPFAPGNARLRLAYAARAGPNALWALIQKVEAAHAALLSQHPRSDSFFLATSEDELLAQARAVDPLMPFAARHMMQQHSIEANMRAAGLLQPQEQPGSSGATGATAPPGPSPQLFLELGAGKGWLSAWLATMAGARHLLLLDRLPNFSLKADRRLRHCHLTRVGIDLKDVLLLQLMHHHLATAAPKDAGDACQAAATTLPAAAAAGVCEEQAAAGECGSQGGDERGGGPGAGAAAGGAACCGRAPAGADSSQALGAGAAQLATPLPAPPQQQQPQEQQQQQQQQQRQLEQQEAGVAEQAHMRMSSTANGGSSSQQRPLVHWVAYGKHLCGAATDYALRACFAAAASPSATCIGGAGGGSVGADGGSGGGVGATSCGRTGCGRVGRSGAADPGAAAPQLLLRGIAIATCCHHRCGWRAYVGKAAMRRFGITPQEFELLAWMTGWALCGHDVPAGERRPRWQAAGAASKGAAGAGERNEGGSCHDSGYSSGDDSSLIDSGGTTAGACGGGAQAVTQLQGCSEDAAGDGVCGDGHFYPQLLLSRASRIALGLKAKQVLDAGRCEWLAAQVQQLRAAELPTTTAAAGAGSADSGGRKHIHLSAVRCLNYVPASLTGETTLLLVAPAAGV